MWNRKNLYFSQQFIVLFTQEFDGNVDRDTIVAHDLNPPIFARCIRFRPKDWHEHISMRVELYGC